MGYKYHFDLICQSTSIYKILEQALILPAEVLPYLFLFEYVFLFHLPVRIDLNAFLKFILLLISGDLNVSYIYF